MISVPMVKRLRHRPFTAVSGVRFSLGTPKKQPAHAGCFFGEKGESREEKVEKARQFKTTVDCNSNPPFGLLSPFSYKRPLILPKQFPT